MKNKCVCCECGKPATIGMLDHGGFSIWTLTKDGSVKKKLFEDNDNDKLHYFCSKEYVNEYRGWEVL